MGSRNIKKGEKFGRMTVVHPYKKLGKSSKWMHLCQCLCGKEKLAYGCHLRRGATISCGCVAIESIKKAATKHGGYGTETYRIWKGIRRRCNNKNDAAYPRYGGAGIKICKEWDDYKKFLSDMGERPKGMSIDRIDGTKGYSKENCRWATDQQQARNRKAKGNLPKGIRELPSGRFAARICTNYKECYLGSSDTIEGALKLRKAGEEKYWNR